MSDYYDDMGYSVEDQEEGMILSSDIAAWLCIAMNDPSQRGDVENLIRMIAQRLPEPEILLDMSSYDDAIKILKESSSGALASSSEAVACAKESVKILEDNLSKITGIESLIEREVERRVVLRTASFNRVLSGFERRIQALEGNQSKKKPTERKVIPLVAKESSSPQETLRDWVKKTAQDAAKKFDQEFWVDSVNNFLKDDWPKDRATLKCEIENWYRKGAIYQLVASVAQDKNISLDYEDIKKAVKDLGKNTKINDNDLEKFANQVIDELSQKKSTSKIHGTDDIKKIAQETGFSPEIVGQEKYQEMIKTWSEALSTASGPDKTGILSMTRDNFVAFIENLNQIKKEGEI